MPNCTDPECHQKLMDTCRLVHNTSEGLPSKVSKSAMAKWIIGTIGYTMSIIIAIAIAWGAAKDEIKQNKQDIAVVENTVTMGFQRMDEKFNVLMESQKRIWKAVKDKGDN